MEDRSRGLCVSLTKAQGMRRGSVPLLPSDVCISLRLGQVP